MFRSNYSQMLYEVGVLENSTKLTENSKSVPKPFISIVTGHYPATFSKNGSGKCIFL